MADTATDDTSGRPLQGSTALITGGGRGIGRAIAIAYARAGASVFVAARTSSEVEAVAAEIKEAGGMARWGVADVSQAEQARGLVVTASEALDGLDVLINNAGGVVSRSGPSDHDPFAYDDGAFADTLALNLMAAHWTSSAALPGMRERGYGRIINIGSGASKGVTPSPIAYHAAKHGLVGLTRALATSVASYGITVNCLCPGPTRTALYEGAHALVRAVDPSVRNAEPGAVPPNLQARVLSPEEIAPMALLLGSRDGGGGITGQVISVDGGYKV